MAGELKHTDAGTQLTSVEDNATNRHVLESQAKGDMVIAPLATGGLGRLGITASRILGVVGGLPAWVNELPAMTLAGTLTLNGQAFDAGSGDAQVNTTGSARGLLLKGTNATHGPGMIFQQEHTTPDLNSIVGIIRYFAYDHAGPPVLQTIAQMEVIHSNIGNGTEEVIWKWTSFAAGAANLAMTLSGAGEVAGDLAYAEFDEFGGKPLDDVMLMVKSQLPALQEIGVIAPKDTGSGYMLNFQKAIYLGWGGIRQNRAKIDNLEERLSRMELALPQGRN